MLSVTNFKLQYSNVDFATVLQAAPQLFITEAAPIAGSPALTDAQVAQLKAAGTKVAGYVDTSVTDDGRPYWNPAWTSNGTDTGTVLAIAPNWLKTGAANPFGIIADFRDAAWRQIVIDQAVDLVTRGYSGVFLDDVAQYFALGQVLGGTSALATEMMSFVVEVKAAITAVDPDAFIIANATPYIVTDGTGGSASAVSQAFLAQTDALLLESFFGVSNPALEAGIQQAVAQILPSMTVLALEYGGTAYQNFLFSNQATALGLVPSASLTAAYNTFAAPLSDSTSGDDTLVGTGRDDTISGQDGGDTITGGAGNDTIYGHSIADTVAGTGDIIATRVATGLNRTVFATSAPGRPNDLFVVEAHTGQIKILNLTTNTVSATPFIDLPQSALGTAGEEGLLGLAFHPDYATNRKFYVFHNTADGNLVVEEYQRNATNPNIADLSSKKQIIGVAHPDNSNHNGGWIGFGPDGYLYISTGDGGGGGDPLNNAQNVNSLLGKMLRIDINGDDYASTTRNYAIPDDNPFYGIPGANEIWALGLRNAWRPSFDRLTGDLYIADVGQGAREEINFQLAASAGGENYGWKIKEGTLVYDPNVPGNLPPNSPLLTDPIHDYGHDGAPNGGFSVTGGYVYRGQSAGLQGTYFFTDFVSNQIWTFRVVNGQATAFENRTAQIVSETGPLANISSFAEDANGNLYAITLSGDVVSLSPGAAAGDGNDSINGGSGNDRIYGGRGNDKLAGNSGDDQIFGGTGDDTLYPGSGIDVVDGGAGFDTVSYYAWTQGATVNLAQQSSNAGAALGDTLNNIERINGSATAADNLRGDNSNNMLMGYGGNDRLSGSGGDDTLRGGAGADTLTGGTGADTYAYTAVSEGGDTISTFSGSDSFQFARSSFGNLVGTNVAAANFVSLAAGNSATTTAHRFIFDQSTDQLWYDSNGSANGGLTLIATMLSDTNLTNADLLFI